MLCHSDLDLWPPNSSQFTQVDVCAIPSIPGECDRRNDGQPKNITPSATAVAGVSVYSKADLDDKL